MAARNSALVKLLTSSRVGGPLGIPADANPELYDFTLDAMGVRVAAGKCVVVGGQNDGSTISDGLVQANQKVIVYPALDLRPDRYTLLLGYNNALAEHGTVSISPVAFPEPEAIRLVFKADRKTDLKEVGHIFEIYMAD